MTILLYWNYVIFIFDNLMNKKEYNKKEISYENA